MTSWKKQITHCFGTRARVSNIYVVGNGVNIADSDTFVPSIKRYDGVFVGTLSHRKGIFDLVTSWKHVVKRIPNAKLILIGRAQNESTQQLLEQSI